LICEGKRETELTLVHLGLDFRIKSNCIFIQIFASPEFLLEPMKDTPMLDTLLRFVDLQSISSIDCPIEASEQMNRVLEA